MRVRDVMTRAAITVAPHDPVDKVADILASLGFTAVPVVDGGRLCGIVTEADLLDDVYSTATSRGAQRPPTDDAAPRQTTARHTALRHTALRRTAAEVMSTEPVCISHDADIAVLARVMIERHLRSVPVMDGDNLVGIITRRDLLRTLSHSDAEMAEHIRKNLSALGRASRWTVRVEDGHAVLQDEYTSAADRHVAKALAESVPGVLSATVTSREPMPANDIESKGR